MHIQDTSKNKIGSVTKINGYLLEMDQHGVHYTPLMIIISSSLALTASLHYIIPLRHLKLTLWRQAVTGVYMINSSN